MGLKYDGALEMTESEDKLWLSYVNEDGEKTRHLKVLFEGFGFEPTNTVSNGTDIKWDEHPRYNEFCELVKNLAIDVFELK